MSPRTVAIMQPTWLPYLGYFQLIASADIFVFLDDVQFARRSWQSRNRILAEGQEQMLTVPVRKQPRDTLIADIAIADGQPWRAQQLNALRHAYAGRPHFAEGYAFLETQLAREPNGRLADLAIGLVEAAAAHIGLSTPFVRASTLGCGGHRSDHLLALCRAVGADHYLSPTGSADYMEDDGVFAAARFPVIFKGFEARAYDQGGADFTPYMSFVDALLNVGWAGMEMLSRPQD
jgi:hypothetical protein